MKGLFEQFGPVEYEDSPVSDSVLEAANRVIGAFEFNEGEISPEDAAAVAWFVVHRRNYEDQQRKKQEAQGA